MKTYPKPLADLFKLYSFTPDAQNQDLNNQHYLQAQSRIDTLTAGQVKAYYEKTTTTDQQRNYIDQALAQLTIFYILHNQQWSRGTFNAQQGGVGISQTFPNDNPEYVPPDVLKLLQMSGVYQPYNTLNSLTQNFTAYDNSIVDVLYDNNVLTKGQIYKHFLSEGGIVGVDDTITATFDPGGNLGKPQYKLKANNGGSNIWEIGTGSRSGTIYQIIPNIIDQQNKTIQNLPAGQRAGEPIEVQQWQTRNNEVNTSINLNKQNIATNKNELTALNGDFGSFYNSKINGSNPLPINEVKQGSNIIFNVVQDATTKKYNYTINATKQIPTEINLINDNTKQKENIKQFNDNTMEVDTNGVLKVKPTTPPKKEIYHYKINIDNNINFRNKITEVFKSPNNLQNSTFNKDKYYNVEFIIYFQWSGNYNITNNISSILNINHITNFTDLTRPLIYGSGAPSSSASVLTFISLAPRNDGYRARYLTFSEGTTRYIYDTSWNNRFIIFDIFYYEI